MPALLTKTSIGPISASTREIRPSTVAGISEVGRMGGAAEIVGQFGQRIPIAGDECDGARPHRQTAGRGPHRSRGTLR